MRVLMTADAVGGVWSYALDLAAGLAEHGVATTLAVTGARLTSAQREELRASPVERCYAADYALEWMPTPWRDVARTNDWLLGIEDAVQPDVVHLNAFSYGSAGFRAPVVTVAHSCVLTWFDAVRGHPAPPEWDRYRIAVAAGLRGADLLVAPTRAMLDAFTRRHAVPCETQVIPNGIEPPAPAAAEKDDVVLGAGRLWDDAKNVAALSRVAARLRWPVEVAGDGAATNVHALGRLGRDALRRKMARARVFCAPARYEPFGLAPLEAASAGCALVLGDIATLREIWGDAALYAPDDDAALADTVERAMREEDWGKRAQARSREYTRARMAEAYVDAYERVVTRSYDGRTADVRA
jgi:glycogen synthase